VGTFQSRASTCAASSESLAGQSNLRKNLLNKSYKVLQHTVACLWLLRTADVIVKQVYPHHLEEQACDLIIDAENLLLVVDIKLFTQGLAMFDEVGTVLLPLFIEIRGEAKAYDYSSGACVQILQPWLDCS